MALATRTAFTAAALLLAACGSDAPRQTYYEREIEPILLQSCSGNTGGCHVVDDADPFGFAAGNFDVTSFENVQKRSDLLRRFGAYEVPLLLVKAVGSSGELGVTYNDEFHPLEVQHVGGSVLRVGSDAYLTLLEWTNNGATENGLPPLAPAETGQGSCSTFVPGAFDETTIVAGLCRSCREARGRWPTLEELPAFYQIANATRPDGAPPVVSRTLRGAGRFT